MFLTFLDQKKKEKGHVSYKYVDQFENISISKFNLKAKRLKFEKCAASHARI